MARSLPFPILSFLLILTACGGSEQKDPAAEPNDKIMQAKVMSTDRTVQLKLDSNKDRDWVGLKVPDSGYLHFGAKGVPDPLDLRIKLALQQEWKKQKAKGLSGWEGIPEAHRIYEHDTVYFAIKDQYQDNSSDSSFKLKPSFIEEFDAYERNDKAKRAKKGTTGKRISSYIYPVGDRDWFKFEVDSAGYLMAQSRKTPGPLNPELAFARKKEPTGKIERVRGFQEFMTSYRAPEQGTYYVLLHDNYDDNKSRDPIEWKMRYLPEMDPQEPNGDPAKAFKISVPDTLSAAIFPKGDRDHFQLTPEKSGKLLVQSQGGQDEFQLQMKVLKKQPTGTEQAHGWSGFPGRFQLKKDTTYYLRLRDEYDDNGSPESFKLSFRWRSNVGSAS